MGVVVRDVERALSLADGFVLMPIECGPDVARDLASSLASQDWAIEVIEPVDDAGWHELVARLLDAGKGAARAVMLIGSRKPTSGVLAALRLVNQRRDAIALALGRPLLWCGPPEFLKLAWERAPDFWSIRAMTTRVSTSGTPWKEEPLWPGAWVTDPPERLRETLERAKQQGDAPIASATATALAHALVARGELAEAAEIVAAARSTPALRLLDGVLAARAGDRARAERIATDSTLAGGAPELEGQRLILLGNLRLDVDPAAAAAAYAEAAQGLGRARDTLNVAVALANLAIVSMGDGALDPAQERLDEALEVARRSGDARTEACVLSKLGRLHLLRRDSRTASAILEEGLTRASDAGDERVEAEILRRLARAYLELGDPERAELDARRAAGLARELEDDDGVREGEEIAREASRAAGAADDDG